MLKRLEERAYWWLKVPPEPAPPAGAPGSLQTFRAGKNYFYLRMVVWVGTQIGAVIGLLFSLYFIQEVELQIAMEQAAIEREAQPANQVEPTPSEDPVPEVAVPEQRLVEVADGVYETEKSDAVEQPGEAFNPADIPRNIFHQLFHNLAPRWLRELPSRVPGDALVWIKLVESLGIVAFIVQFFWSLLAVQIDYKQRWYMVTDRSLRLRWGVVRIQESTMSFANLQQVSVKQGPLQRLLKLADVEVRSAGGGSSDGEENQDDSMHRSVFRAVENAPEIRDMILTRLKRFRQAGLGEPDDIKDNSGNTPEPAEGSSSDAISAAREVLAEARALRAEL